MNRRDWMITAIAAVGLPSTEPRPAGSEPQSSSFLPPGLYLPSTEHLGHALAQAEQPRSTPHKPEFFSPPEYAIIRQIAALILGEEANSPASENAAAWIDLRASHSAAVREAALSLDPLHHALAVSFYGAVAVREMESYDPQKICREGLAWLAEKGNFLSLNTDSQIATLDSISDARPDKHLENAGTRFFAYIKSEVIKGFYTSRAGLRELDFKGNGFYASSPGCKTNKS
jgi:hypothetical protein